MPNRKIYQANIVELLKRIRRLANAAPLSPEEYKIQSEDWMDILIDEVPLSWLPDLYKRAAWNHPNSHMVNAFDLIAEFKTKSAEIAAEKKRAADLEHENNPIARCTHKKYHANDKGEITAFNYYSDRDELTPCAHCRLDELEKWKKTQIALYGQPKPPMFTVKGAVEQIVNKREPEVYLSAMEAMDIQEPYNELVFKLVEDETARNNLYVYFDEGANRFRHKQTAAILYTANDMQKKIADYQKILDEKQ